ncbi:MAG TPA: VWA domain-containing protein [Pyrinomonadaceae bacterium]|jgi:VWFA-related protein
MMMMKFWMTVVLILALTMTSVVPALAQTRAGQDDEDERIVVGANEVLIDVVVKDKKGRAVKDLKSSDFEVYEDGVRQQVQSFRLVTREPATTNAANNETAAASTSKPEPATQRPAEPSSNVARVGAIALVFDRLSPDARSRARQAALSYLNGGLRPDDFIGVFGIDLSLSVLQSFTNNEQLVRQAIERAASHSSSSFGSSTGRIGELSQRATGLQEAGDALRGNTPGPGAGAGQGVNTGEMSSAIANNAIDQTFTEMTRRSLETFELLERNQQGYATTNGLIAIINSLSRLPGRKIMILFSEGLAIPSAVEAVFRSVISNANRANVSIYTVDAAGLRVLSSDAEAGRAMTALGRRRASIAASGREDTSGPMTRDLERNEDLLRLNPESGLGQLANQTGGMFIGNTNDPGPRLRQIDQDLHSYYVLSYVPKNQNYDGRFRQLNVKLNHSGLDVQTRKGYYAINTADASPVLAYEAPALAILGGNSQPNSFPSHVSAFNFPSATRPGLVPVLVEAPSGSINFSIDNAKKLYNADFSIIALIKDSSQRVVRKLSNQYLLSGPLDKLEAAKRGEILFYRETELEPGRYTVMAVVYDAKTNQASTSTSTLVVPAQDQTSLRMSSIVIVKRAERASVTDQQAANPFHFGDVLLYPNLDEPLHKSTNKDLPFFLTIYGAPAAKPAPKLTLEIMQSGRTLARGALELPAPEPTGRIQYASAIPIEGLKPGDYELKITARDGQSTIARSTHFTLMP